MDTTGKQFVEFWSWAAKKDLLNKNTAKSFAAPVRQIISVNENLETMDVSRVDATELFRRFQNVRGKDFRPDSLNAYSRRFKQALDLFLRYTNDPTSWKFKGYTNTGRKTKPAKADQQQRDVLDDALEMPVSQTGSVTPMIDYQFPLRDNCIVRLKLPADLKVSEVDRLAAFMRILVLDIAPS